MRFSIKNPTNLNFAEVERALVLVSPRMKSAMAVANAGVRISIYEIVDDLKKRGLYTFKIKKSFGRVIEAYEKYEKRLRHSDETAYLFSVSSITPEYRRRYKDDFTDEEYFNLWLDAQAFAYDRYKALAEVARHKYQLAFENAGYKHAYVFSKFTTACMLCIIADQVFESITKTFAKETGIRAGIFQEIFSPFSVSCVYEVLKKAEVDCMNAMGAKYHVLDAFDVSNIRMTSRQISDIIVDDANHHRSEYDAAEDNEDLYKTNGFYLKVLEEIKSYNSKD